MGNNKLSKKTKNDNISKAVNDNTKKSSNTKKYKQYSLICANPFFQDVSKHKGTTNVLNRIKNMDMPSMPKVKKNLCKNVK